ncbi:MAG: isoprenylcysteine carboxylmethyltransferase family protein [Gammaproteobacteria bacterium]
MNTDDDHRPESDPHGPGVRVHPPVIYAGSILSGMAIDNYWPQSMPFGIHGYLYASIIIAFALLIAGFSIFKFYQARTDVRPDKPDSALIRSGPYRLTRNPLYIVLTLVQITIAVWLNNAWILALAIVSVFVITQYAIKREERYLEKIFGQDYLDYKQRVRRWL